jgi:hypothetical protein
MKVSIWTPWKGKRQAIGENCVLILAPILTLNCAFPEQEHYTSFIIE